jgi:(1->4)-alpha-D-glucan 1-alpha-D-glucosylmutase
MTKPRPEMSRPRVPAATYRLQFNRSFTFDQAREIVPYLHELGISDCYSSPYFEATPDSPHGYDISDHNNLNPTIGSRESYNALVAELQKHGMGQIADFVPNHMGITSANNKWWMDVLENGPSSQYASHFDIDWSPLKEELENKVLLPILGDQYGRVLERGEFQLSFEEGAFFLHYYDFKLPISPCSYNQILRPALELLHQYYNEELFDEMESILNAIEHLPAPTELDPDKIHERSREKEVIKRRLFRLCSECPQMQEGIDQALDQLQGEPGNSPTFDPLHNLLNAQMYRLSFWRVAAEEINYRRFFDINDLAAIRVERPEVFEASHQLLFELLREDAVTGVRLDHPDGLWNPCEYVEALQRRYAELKGIDFSGTDRPLYLLAEKILTGPERLPENWLVHGTTGYDFTTHVTGILVDKSVEKEITDTYFGFLDHRMRFDDLVYEQKRLVMRLSLANETNVLGHMLNRLSERNRWYRDFTLNSLITAVREVIACFPIYRTYLAPGHPISVEDQQAILIAVARAKRRNPAIESSVFNFLRDNLLFKFPENIDEATVEEHFRFVMKFQQCTGPIMAKGLEDTAFYIYNRLVALNEVGGEPQHFGTTVDDFHQINLFRQQKWPHSMLCTSSHDTKRSEDVRARIAAISEMPKLWKDSLQKWSETNRRHKTGLDGEFAPDMNEEYLIYQTLLGTWPLHRLKSDEYAGYTERIQNYMTKAIKEAKVNSSWIQPYEEWDNAVREFVARILDREGNRGFFDTFDIVAQKIAQLGAMNSLSQTLLKLTLPGVPDIYQGNEIWDLSLVDPDNRRPVDYALRRDLLEKTRNAEPAELLQHWRDGRIKLFLTRTILHFRRRFPALFREGGYARCDLGGNFAECGIAFERRHEDHVLIVFAPRLSDRVGFPPLGKDWADTRLEVPSSDGELKMKNLLTGETVKQGSGPIQLAEVLKTLPFLVLSNKVEP